MTVNELPLLKLFTDLRAAGLTLGIDDYRLALRALQLGHGTRDDNALANMCRTLWVKSEDDESRFKPVFERVMGFAPPLRSEPKPGLGATGNNPLPMDEPVKEKVVLEPGEPVMGPVNGEESDPVVVSMLVRHSTSSEDYFPITRQQMKQSWRRLPRTAREGPPVELDIDATIEKLNREKFLYELVLMARRVRINLDFLVDQEGSMAPFHILSRQLAQTGLHAGRLDKTTTFYFHNCPIKYLYKDPSLYKSNTVKEFLTKLDDGRTSVLIFSDAGAARGFYSHDRLDETDRFLKKLKKNARRVVWLNPMPQFRWYGTTASLIAELVPMFELSREGVGRAVGVLCGK